MRFLVTGGAGFIGSHLADALVARGDEVVALDNLSTGDLANIRGLEHSPLFTFVPGSVLDPQLVDELVEASDVVVHLAAAVGVRLVMEQPLRTLITNIRGSENVLEAAHRYRRKVLVASTSEIYGKNDADLLAEDADRILGSPSMNRWVYSTSKAVDEYLAIAYWKEKCLPTIVTRFFNTVGPRQSPAYGMVLPRLIDQALAGEPLTVYGDGTQTRCFGFVGDVVRAILGLLAEPDAVGEVFNVGASDEVTINELAERILHETGSASEITHVPYEQVYTSGFEDMRRRVPDTAKIRSLLGWEPSVSLDQIVAAMVDHARSRQAGLNRAALEWHGQRWGEVLGAAT